MPLTPQQIAEMDKITGLTSENLQRSRIEELRALPDMSPKKEKGLLRTIAEDVTGTLAVRPVARATEAVTRTLAPNSLAAKGFEQMADSGESQEIGGIEVDPVKAFGEGGLKQVGGEALQTTSYLIPYGRLAKLAGAATGSRVAGNVLSGATGGYTADVGYGLTDEDETTGEALAPGVGTAIGSAIPAIGPALRATGRLTSKVGSKIAELPIPISQREAGILQSYKATKPFLQRVGEVLSGTSKTPSTMGSTAVKTKAGQTIGGLFGTKAQIGVQAKRASNSLWKDVLEPRLKNAEVAVNLPGFFSKVEKDIIESTPELTRRNSLLEAMEAVKEDYAGKGTVTLEELQKLKEGWAEFVPERAYQGKSIAGALNEVRDSLADEARGTIYEILGPDARQVYIDYGNLKGLQELGKTAMTGSKLKGGAGTFISEVLSRIVTPVTTVGGQAVYRVGKGIEFIGNAGAKNLGQALGIQFPGDKLLQDLTAPTKKQSSQIPKKIRSTSIPDNTSKIKSKYPPGFVRLSASKVTSPDIQKLQKRLEGKQKLAEKAFAAGNEKLQKKYMKEMDAIEQSIKNLSSALNK